MRRLLLVTHRPIAQPGGATARWRAFAHYLPEYGWEVDVLSATERAGSSEFDGGASWAVTTRARAMGTIARLSEPVFNLAGVRPDSMPLSMLWAPHGALLVRRRTERRAPDVVLASGPPMAGPIAARAGVGASVPLVVELRDLWASSPAFDAGGRALPGIEGWLLRGARRVVACTPEAVSDLRRRHPEIDGHIVEVSNGFDPRIRSIVRPIPERAARTDGSRGQITLLHSGTLTAARPIAPLVRALGDPRLAGRFRLILHGYISPASQAEVELARRQSGVPIETLAPCAWEEAVRHIAQADAGLITQAQAAGDATAVASKIYEYLALGKPVLCMTDGGASEALLRRIGADTLCCRLSEPETIIAALLRLHEGRIPTAPAELLERYSRQALARRMAALLEDVARGGRRPASE